MPDAFNAWMTVMFAPWNMMMMFAREYDRLHYPMVENRPPSGRISDEEFEDDPYFAHRRRERFPR